MYIKFFHFKFFGVDEIFYGWSQKVGAQFVWRGPFEKEKEYIMVIFSQVI